MDPITIGSLIAVLAGGYMQHQAVAQQAERQAQLARLSQMGQLQAQDRATKVVAQTSEDFDATKRKAVGDALAGQLQQTFEQAAQPTALTAQGVQVGTTLPAGQGGSAYTADQAREAAKTAESMRQFAAIMGRTTAPGLQREREAVKVGDAAGAVGRIQTGANNIAGIDRIGIQSVLPNAALSIGGQALQAYGVGKLATSGMSPAKEITTNPNAWTNG
jgi:hypothetical protein